jgi:hypothetical protein
MKKGDTEGRKIISVKVKFASIYDDDPAILFNAT